MRTNALGGPLLLLGLAAAGCNGDPEDTDTGEPALEHQFSFAVLADPHIVGNPDHAARLTAAVEWINGQAEARSIELVFVVGDIAWGNGFQAARNMLDGLSMPYLPLTGDNEIQVGNEEDYDTAWAPHYLAVAAELEDWRRAETPSWNPDHDTQSWFQNFSFQHRGVHFVALDWASREIGTLYGETADLHDFEGGTWPWFEDELARLASPAGESVVMLSHMPMHLGMFSGAELETVTALTSSMGDVVAANYAGHYHIDIEQVIDDGDYVLFVTDATWDDDDRVRVVEVWGNGERFEYVQDLVAVPLP
jgi:hypothetical protein